MAIFNRFNSFIEAVFEKKHNIGSDDIKIALTDTLPVSSNSAFSDISEIVAGNGYVAGGVTVTVDSSSQTGGVYTATLSGDTTFTASGGSISAFQYAVLYNDTASNDELIGWWDIGESVDPSDGESFTFRTDAVTLFTAS